MKLKKVHKEGYKIIAGSSLFLLLLNAAIYYYTGKSVGLYIVAGISIILFALMLIFFRNLNRIFFDDTTQVVVAPADGKIVVVEEVTENEYFHDNRIQVSIFMSLFNAHVNWIPVNGEVIHYTHQNGRFKAAYLPKSSTENERSTIVIKTPEGQEILVRQIAGAMAKRIVTYVEEGKNYEINEQLGFIKFGSRVDLFLPLNSDIKVELGQKVAGNHTLIAQLK